MIFPRRATRRRLALLLVAVLSSPAAADGPLKTFTYSGEGSLKAAYGDLTLLVDVASLPDDTKAVRLRGFDHGRAAFLIKLDIASSDQAKAKVELVDLAPGGPQVLFQHFTYGAHCCTETRIAVPHDGTWTVVDGDVLDGDAGYAIRDIDGDGTQELVGEDDSFLYAFSSYAESLAPIRIEKLKGTRLVDVSADPRYRSAVRKRLAEIEDKDDLSASRFDSNGFLAGWLATKILLGEGPAAWRRVLAGAENDPDVAPEVCLDKVDVAACRDGRRRQASFPEALRAHLLAHGYITSVADYPLPSSGATR